MAYETFITYETMYDDIMVHLLPKLPRNIFAVVGIPRSGMIPATIISTELHVPMGLLGSEGLFGGNRIKNVSPKPGDKILLIDDSVSTGDTFKMHAAAIKELGKNVEVIRACVYMRPGSEKVTPLFARHMQVPRIFEWNLFNSHKIGKMVFDLDGVFCHDPEMFDDDGVEYQNYIANATPLHIPSYPIKAICTSRIERWRSITEDWLKRYGIQYGELIMMPFATADDRRKKGNKSKFKAQNYVKLNGSLFVESSKHQARKIAGFSKKKVLCLEDKLIY